MSGYTPVFDDIYHGTLYGRWPTAAVWASLLPLIDRRGEINKSYEAIAGMTGWPMELLRTGIAELCAPDHGSRTASEEGRRLVLIDPVRPWGWRVVNHGKYREKARKMAYDRERTDSGHDADRKREERTRPDVSRDVPTPPALHTPEADAEAKAEARSGGRRAARAETAKRLPENFELTPERQATARAEAVNPEREFARFCDHWRAAAGSNARKHDWDAAWRNWCRKAAEITPRNGAAVPVRTWRPGPEDCSPEDP